VIWRLACSAPIDDQADKLPLGSHHDPATLPCSADVPPRSSSSLRLHRPGCWQPLLTLPPRPAARPAPASTPPGGWRSRRFHLQPPTVLAPAIPLPGGCSPTPRCHVARATCSSSAPGSLLLDGRSSAPLPKPPRWFVGKREGAPSLYTAGIWAAGGLILAQTVFMWVRLDLLPGLLGDRGSGRGITPDRPDQKQPPARILMAELARFLRPGDSSPGSSCAGRRRTSKNRKPGSTWADRQPVRAEPLSARRRTRRQAAGRGDETAGPDS